MSTAAQPIALELPPHSIEAEQSVLGAILLDPSTMDRIRHLRPEHFLSAPHRIIFQAMLDCVEASDAIDAVTVSVRVEQAGDSERIGGAAYLIELVKNTPSAYNAGRYAEIVKEHWQRRQLAALGAEMHDLARAGRTDAATLRRDAEAKLLTIAPAAGEGRALDLCELATREPPERVWAIFGWMPMGAAMLLAGPGGAGKTRLMLQIAACLVLGRDFIDTVSCRLRVLVWACEDDADELWRILAQIAKWLNVQLDALADGLMVVPRIGLGNTIYAAGEYGRSMFAPALDELRAQAREHRAQVVFLDNVAQIYGGQPGNNHQVTECINGIMGAIPPGAALCMLGHPARAQGSEFSGAAAWENAVRARLYLGPKLPDQKQDDDEPNDDARFLARRKANYANRDWRRLEYRDGVLVPDDVNLSGGVVGYARDQRAEHIVMDGFRKLVGMGLQPSDGATSPHFLPRLLIEHKLAEGNSKSELGAAMRRLMGTGKFWRGVVGTYANRAPKHGLVAVE